MLRDIIVRVRKKIHYPIDGDWLGEKHRRNFPRLINRLAQYYEKSVTRYTSRRIRSSTHIHTGVAWKSTTRHISNPHYSFPLHAIPFISFLLLFQRNLHAIYTRNVLFLFTTRPTCSSLLPFSLSTHFRSSPSIKR